MNNFWQGRQYGGSSDHAQPIASHEVPRTIKLYDGTSDEISLGEIERIVL